MIFLTVLKQVIVLFILIFVGLLFGKKNIINDNSVKSLTDIVLCLVSPSVIIKSFIREYDSKMLYNIILSFLLAIVVHALFIFISSLIVKDKVKARKSVLRFGAIFGNCGFMSIPIQEAILGETGVIYCASFIAIFNLFAWTYGVVLMSGDKKEMSVKKMFINPGMIGLVIGLAIFISRIKVPEVISLPIGYFAALNTPLPMLIIGYHLSKSNIKTAFKDLKLLYACVCKLIILPVFIIALLYLIPIRGDLLVSFAISTCAPVAAYTTMFSYKYNRATELSVNMVSLSTLFSLITMPLIIAVTQMIA